MRITNLNSLHGFGIIDLLATIAIILTIATITVGTVSQVLQSGERAAAQRELQSLNSALQHFQSAGGVIPQTNNSSTAITALRVGTYIEGEPFTPLQSDPLLSLNIGGETYSLTYNSEQGFTYQSNNSSPIPPASLENSSPQNQPYPPITDQEVIETVLRFASLDPADPSHDELLGYLTLAMNESSLAQDTILFTAEVMAGSGWGYNPTLSVWEHVAPPSEEEQLASALPVLSEPH